MIFSKTREMLIMPCLGPVLNSGVGFAYDANGNPSVYKGVSPLTYDEEDRLTGYSTSMSAGYTSDGLRAWKDSGSGKTYFLYAKGIPVWEIDASGNIVATNTFGPTGLLARHTGSTDSFYTFDPQGNVSQTLDASGNVASTQLYDSYGELLSGSATPPFGFGAQHGYYTDPETGLLLLTHRYYDPEEGRFLTRDPIGYSGGMNLYGYVGNNPVTMIDPLGLSSEEKYPPHWLNFLNSLADEINPFDPKSALYRQGVSIGDFYRGDIKSAASNSGWAQLQEVGASRGEFAAYTATQVTAGAAICGAIAANALGVGDVLVGWKGGEIIFTKPGKPTPDVRISPFGHPNNSRAPKSNPDRELPHYHRRPGIDKHRPWEGGW
jgi:RHS repeat-associated protein